jgi:hypothetical protein
LAVNAGDVAVPALSVVTEADEAPPVKVPLAPVPGAVKVTVEPATGVPLLSVTVATSGLLKAVPTPVACPDPDVALIFAGVPPPGWMTSCGGVAVVSRLDSCLSAVDVVVMTKVYVPLPVTVLLTSSDAQALLLMFGMAPTMVEPGAGALL